MESSAFHIAENNHLKKIIKICWLPADEILVEISKTKTNLKEYVL